MVKSSGLDEDQTTLLAHDLPFVTGVHIDDGACQLTPPELEALAIYNPFST